MFHNNDKLKLMKSFSLFLEDTALINAKWLLLRPIEHYRQVHEHDEDSKKKKKVPNIQPPSSFFKKRESSSQSVVEGWPSTTSSSSSSIKTASLQPKKPIFGDIRNIDPTIYLKQNPTNDLQKWAVGTVFKTVHQGANKCLSNAAVVENYEIGYEMVNEYHNTIKSSHDQLHKIPPPPKVPLNCHNILDVQKAILEVNLLYFNSTIMKN